MAQLLLAGSYNGVAAIPEKERKDLMDSVTKMLEKPIII